jgi:polyhydroxybutyrate depolymerase
MTYGGRGMGRGTGSKLAVAVAALTATVGACSSGSGSTSPGTTAAVLPASASSGCAAAASPPSSGPQSLDMAGTARKYLISLPDETSTSGAPPLVLDLHGFGETAEAQDASTDMAAEGTRRGYIVVTPEALVSTVGTKSGPLWNDTAAFTGVPEDSSADVELSSSDDVAFLNKLVDHLEQTQCIDTDREFITGMSAGAGMTTWMACQPDSRFAAWAPVAGLTQGLVCPSTVLAPFVAFAGTGDQQVEYAGGKLAGFELGIPAVEDRMADFAARQGCGAGVTSTPIGSDVVHMVWGCPPGAAAELYKILGGAHTWPGSNPTTSGDTATISATTVILDFFDQHPRPPGDV